MDILLGFVLPAVFAGGIYALLSRAPAESAFGRFAPSAAFVGGFLLGYFALKLGPIIPASHWHWLPCLMLLPLVLGPVSQAAGVTALERVLVYGLIAAIAGWALVPTWEDLKPPRETHLVFWGVWVVLFAAVLEPLSRRLSGSLLGLVFLITMVCGAGVLVFGGSLRFGQIAGAGAGALAGLSIACRFTREARSLKGLAIGFLLLLSGMLLVGRVNSFSNVPLGSYLLVHFAPASLWVLALGPLSRWEGIKRNIIAVILPTAICVAALALAAWGDLS